MPQIDSFTDHVVNLLSDLEDLRRAASKLQPAMIGGFTVYDVWNHANGSKHDNIQGFERQFRMEAEDHTDGKPMMLLWNEYQRVSAKLAQVIKAGNT